LIKDILFRTLRNREQINYLIVGAWNTFFGYLTYYFLYNLLNKKINYIIILVPSNIIAITNAYICYKIFVFRSKGNFIKEYFRFYIVYGISLLLNFILLALFVEILAVTPLIAQAAITIITVSLSYIIHKKYTFRNDSL
jgi:putative flippase GtrA